MLIRSSEVKLSTNSALAILILLSVLFPRVGEAKQNLREAGEGVLSVPVSDDLKEFSEFQVQHISVRSKRGYVEVHYELPLELTGVTNDLEFFGAPRGDTAELKGPHGTMKCTSFTTKPKCDVKYENLLFDKAARDQMVRATARDEREAQGRITVAEVFWNEPFGVMSFERSTGQ